MPDISMCNNEKCIMKELCFRFTATPSEFSQSYDSFVPKDNSELDFECESFVSNKYRNG